MRRETDAPVVTRSITPPSIRFSRSIAACLVAAPGQRKRDVAVRAHPFRIGQREPRAVGEAVAVLVAEDRQDQQVRQALPDDARRVIGIAGHDDLHRPLVDDDHEHDLRRVGDRREALAAPPRARNASPPAAARRRSRSWYRRPACRCGRPRGGGLPRPAWPCCPGPGCAVTVPVCCGAAASGR